MGIRQTLARHPLLRVFGAILLVAMLGGLGVLALERRAVSQEFGSIPEALWWAIVTMTTVGYGDYTPKGFTGRVLAVAIMFAGISLMAVLSGTVASRLVARRLRANLGLHPIKVRDHIIVCGWYHKMESLLNALLSVEYEDKDYEVVLINEEQEDKMQSLKDQFGYTRLKYIRGDFAREATLKKAQLESARAVIILPTELPTGGVSHEKTVLATLTIKNMNADVQVVAYVHSWASIMHVRRANADEVVLVDNFGSFFLAAHILNPGIPEVAEELLDSYSEHRFQRVKIPREFVGRPFEDLFQHHRKESGWMTVGLYTNEQQVNIASFLSSDESQLDAFIERKLREAGHGESESSSVSVIVNPPPEHVILEGEGAIIIP